MSRKIRRILVKGVIAVLLVAGICTATIGTASAATAKPQTETKATSTPSGSSCYRLVVYLHGSSPATTTCLQEQKPSKAADSPSPDLSTSCGSHLTPPWLVIYQDINYGGASLCFVGTGYTNLYNYWIIFLIETWSDQLSSFTSGATGVMTTENDGYGDACFFYLGLNSPWIDNWCGGSGWNDNINWIEITGS
jgi:hypothetical protein